MTNPAPPNQDESSPGPKVQVLYFAALRDEVGLAEEWVRLPGAAAPLADLLRLLQARHARLNLQAVRVALNEEFTDASASVADGDVVALIPPVSGG